MRFKEWFMSPAKRAELRQQEIRQRERALQRSIDQTVDNIRQSMKELSDKCHAEIEAAESYRAKGDRELAIEAYEEYLYYINRYANEEEHYSLMQKVIFWSNRKDDPEAQEKLKELRHRIDICTLLWDPSPRLSEGTNTCYREEAEAWYEMPPEPNAEVAIEHKSEDIKERLRWLYTLLQ